MDTQCNSKTLRVSLTILFCIFKQIRHRKSVILQQFESRVLHVAMACCLIKMLHLKTRSCATAQKTAVGHCVYADAIHTASFVRSRVYSDSMIRGRYTELAWLANPALTLTLTLLTLATAIRV